MFCNEDKQSTYCPICLSPSKLDLLSQDLDLSEDGIERVYCQTCFTIFPYLFIKWINRTGPMSVETIISIVNQCFEGPRPRSEILCNLSPAYPPLILEGILIVIDKRNGPELMASLN